VVSLDDIETIANIVTVEAAPLEHVMAAKDVA
jgi:hypothetical protein